MVRFLLKGSVGLMIFGIMISACGPLSETNQIVPTPASCTPEKNDYKIPIEPRLVDIYEKAVIANNSGTNGYDEFRKQAFNELVNRVYDWSDSVEIKIGGKTVRITITYVSPELAQLILLNHYLYKMKLEYTGKLDNQFQSDLTGIFARNEHIFFIIFTASQYENAVTGENTLKMSFPIRKLELTNVENMTTKPERDDHNLENTITLTGEPAYGFFYYPMAIVTNNGDCITILDRNRDTRIVLSVPNFSINGKNHGARSWEYGYAPLLQIVSDPGLKNGKFSLTPDIDVISPSVNKMRATSLDAPEFWAALARLIWQETTQDP